VFWKKKRNFGRLSGIVAHFPKYLQKKGCLLGKPIVLKIGKKIDAIVEETLMT
jgi:hypothetical protein